MVEVMSVLIKPGSALGFRALAETKIWCAKGIYHISNSRECIGVNGDTLQLYAVFRSTYVKPV